MLNLRVFGGLALEDDDPNTPALSVQRKPLALLALVAVAGEQGIAREKIASYLWPESDAEHSRNALSQMLHHLRRRCRCDAVGGGSLLRADAAYITSDVARFRVAIDEGQLANAAGLYAGAFLDGVYIHGASEFERWVEDQRQHFAEEYAAALESLARQAEDAHDLSLAVAWWRKLVRHSPVSAPAVIGLMRALASTGDYGGALQVARMHESIVRDEFDAVPSPEIQVLAEALRHQQSLSSVAPASHKAVKHATSERTAQSVPLPGTPVTARRQKSVILAMTGSVIAAVLLGTSFTRAGSSHERPVVTPSETDSERVVVSTFDNLTRDSTLDFIGPMAAEWVTEGLARTGVVRVAGHSVELWSDSAQAANRRGGARWKQVGRWADSRLVLHGAYFRIGDTLRVDAVLSNAATGRLIQAVDPVAGSIRDPMPVLDRLRQRVMSVMAARVNPELEHWIGAAGQPTNFEAFREYADGMAAFADSRWREARTHFLKSAAEDTTYILPLIWAAFAGDDNDDGAIGDSVARLLGPRRAEMAPIDRALYEFLTASTNQMRYEATRRLVELAPGSEFQWKFSRANWDIGHPREALRILRQLDPTMGWVRSMHYWDDRMELHYLLGEYAAAHEANNHDAEVHGWGFDQLAREAKIRASLGDTAGFESTIQQMALHPEFAGYLGSLGASLWSGARRVRAHGEVAAARRLDEWGLAALDSSTAYKRAARDPVARVITEFSRSGMLYDLGRLPEARARLERLDALLRIDSAVSRRVRDVNENFDFGVSVLGYLADLAVRRHEPTLVHRYRERILNSKSAVNATDKYMLGRIAALEGDRDVAVRLLGEARATNINWLEHYRIDPALDGLRSYAPFHDLMTIRQ